MWWGLVRVGGTFTNKALQSNKTALDQRAPTPWLYPLTPQCTTMVVHTQPNSQRRFVFVSPAPWGKRAASPTPWTLSCHHFQYIKTTFAYYIDFFKIYLCISWQVRNKYKVRWRHLQSRVGEQEEHRGRWPTFLTNCIIGKARQMSKQPPPPPPHPTNHLTPTYLTPHHPLAHAQPSKQITKEHFGNNNNFKKRPLLIPHTHIPGSSS